MPLPTGFVEESQASAIPAGFEAEQTAQNLPSGFVPEEKPIPEFRQAPQKGMFEKMISFFKDPERDVAKAQNIYALSEVTGLPMHEVNKNYEILRRSVKVTGITPDLDRKEFTQMVLLPGIAVGAVANPIGTAAGLIAFGALDKAIPTEKLINNLKEQGINDDVIATVELADLVGKGLIVGGVFKKAPGVAEGFLKQKITEYKLPSILSLSSEQVRDIYQTGKLTTPEQQSLFGSLELNSYDTRAALEHGININIPAEKIVRLVDKPYWAKVKGLFGIEPTNKAVTLSAEQPTIAPAGFLEAPKKFSEIVDFYNKEIKDTPEGLKIPLQEFKIFNLSQETLRAMNSNSPDVFISSKVIKHIQESRPKIADYIIKNIPSLLNTSEIYTNVDVSGQGLKRAENNFVFVKRNGNNFGTILQVKNIEGKNEVVTIMTMPLDEIKKLEPFKVQVSQSGTTAVRPSGPTEVGSIASEEAPLPESGFPALQADNKNIPQENEVVKGITPVQKVIQVLKEAESVRGEQETLHHKARTEKFAKMQAVGEKVRGEKGFYAQLGALKGELPKAEFESIRGKLTQEDIDVLFNMVKDSPKISEWDKLSAREGLVKLFGEYGGKVPTENEISLLNKVFGEEFTKAILEKKSFSEKAKYIFNQTINIPKSLMASFDLSAPFRQGIFLIGKPKQFFGSFKRMFGAFKSEVAFNAIQDAIIKDPDFQLARDSKLSLTEMDVLLGEREEAFLSSWAEKIPLVGTGVKASNRAYVGFLNKLRFDVFKDLVDKADVAGLKARENKDLSKAIADFVNNATGRGTLPNGLQKSAVSLNSFFFSPRLVFSRINLLNPVYYIKQPPFVRKEALKSLLAFIGFGVTILTLAKMAGAEVGSDPRSSDFGKVKIGSTRMDVWGGFQQLAVMASRLVTGKIVSSTTGKEMTLGEGYKPMTRADIIQHFIESKEAPVASFITTLLKGKDFSGEDISVPKEIGVRFVPMVMQDMYDLAQETPGLLPVGLLGIFGVGIQTYKQKQYF